ncbi:hypothetical protein Bpfe_008283 [Biomphalaria pfeifferi]|uniref:Uncharacterized protein n=1 Tax=Biomphalaria pfeifferi TaxID=112525 RepID=A0AAD8BY24_BIOPF|nr:hypothetical protein Bpfe_008283 [Biomphalaria pfeifferi]
MSRTESASCFKGYVSDLTDRWLADWMTSMSIFLDPIKWPLEGDVSPRVWQGCERGMEDELFFQRPEGRYKYESKLYAWQ